MTVRTPGQAIGFARRNRSCEPGFCLRYVRTAYGVDPAFLTAADAWTGSKFKHPVKSGVLVPRGAPVYWTGGSKGFGHIAIGTGNGSCWSTDAAGAGVVAKVNIDELTVRFNIAFQGWAEDVNGVRVFDTTGVQQQGGAGKTTVRLKRVLPDPRDDVREVQRALKRRVPKATKEMAIDGIFGPITQDAYAAWQRRCGFKGSDADGVPGKISLQRLGFDVR